jgi:hypothetical protein
MTRHFRTFLCSLLTCWLTATAAAAKMSDGGRYYLRNDYYGLVLGVGDEPAVARLTDAAGADASAACIVVAEATAAKGVWRLRNEQTGFYLKAADAERGVVEWSEERGMGLDGLWSLDTRLGGVVCSMKAPTRRLGCDWTEADVIPVRYDLQASGRARWSVFPALDEGYEASLRAARTDVFTNAQGRPERDFWQIGSTVRVYDFADIHLVGDVPFTAEGQLEVMSPAAWVVLEHVSPSEVIADYLPHIRFMGRPSVNGVNVRVAVWLDGAVVMPFTLGGAAMTGYCDTGRGGTSFSLTCRNHADLGANGNAMRSFVLRRGYMATLSTEADGGGYSRVFVADHSDLVIDLLPEALDRRVTSVNIRPWQYVGKRGWCSTEDEETMLRQAQRLHAGWFYTWAADRSSTPDAEYVPMLPHLDSELAGDADDWRTATCLLGLNEPDHPVRHNASVCGCGGVISPQQAAELLPQLTADGLRIGSPAPTDLNWLYNYVRLCDQQASRCDFVALHAYWGPNEANGPEAWYRVLREIYDTTHRPIWITEWAYGGAQTSEPWPADPDARLEKNRAAVMEIQEMLERCPFVERYSYYQWQTASRRLVGDDGVLTPAGRVYRDCQTDFAFRADMQCVPRWERPAPQKAELNCVLDEEVEGQPNTLTFVMTNPNGDCTDTYVLRRIADDGTVSTLLSVDDRSLFDQPTFSLTLPLSDFDPETDSYCIESTTLFGDDVSSDEVELAYVQNGKILVHDSDDIAGWTCLRSADKGATRDPDGNTSLEAWSADPDGMYFDYYQELDHLRPGIYRLSALCFNSTDGVDDATVNGAVGLYAQAEGVEYFSPVTDDTDLDPNQATTIDQILVGDGQLRIGIKNIAPMTARRAGADNFRLQYLGPAADVLEMSEAAFLHVQRNRHDELLCSFFTPSTTEWLNASMLIANPQCTRHDMYGWEYQNLNPMTRQGWNGSATNPYWDRWQSGALHSHLSQVIPYPPAGRYRLCACMRAKAGIPFRLTATVVSGDRATDYSAEGLGTGEQTDPESTYRYGWQRLYTHSFRVQQGDQIIVTASADADATAWWSVDHFILYCLPDEIVYDNIEEVQSAKYEVQKTDDKVFDQQGRLVGHRTPDVEQMPKGLYIRNGKKFLIQ